VLLSTGNKTDRIVIALAALVALSRIHVRIHHASDVAGGIVIGFLYAQIVKRLFPL
jgi:undecaprenyl-diphosphatase